MNGAADLGGMMGFGSVIPESEGAPFRTEWEGRVHAMVLAIGPVSRWSMMESRGVVGFEDGCPRCSRAAGDRGGFSIAVGWQ
jgi:Nitrile hydratase beta subunit